MTADVKRNCLWVTVTRMRASGNGNVSAWKNLVRGDQWFKEIMRCECNT